MSGNKIDSNIVGLAIAEETEIIGKLPETPVWRTLEPNGFNDFGGQISTVARNFINPSRQREKGVTTDLDASGGFGQDLTQSNITRLLQGFLFADVREKTTTHPLNAAQIPITGVDGTGEAYEAASGLGGFSAGDLILASGFGDALNNGLKSVSVGGTATSVMVNEDIIDEVSPPSTAALERVGFSFGLSEVGIDVNSQTYPRLVRSSGTKDFTDFGLIPGEWVFIGGEEGSINQFSNAVNNGFARVRAVGTTFIEFDKTSSTMQQEAGTNLEIRIFFGHVVKNEHIANLIKRRSYQIERTVGSDANGTMSEYLVGAVPNELSLQIRQADKITVDFSFVATDNEQRTGAEGLKPGTRVGVESAPAFNTSSDFSRIKMHIVSTNGTTNPTPLFGFLTELTLTVNNNVSPNKAVAVLGAFDMTAGQFAVSGSVTAYFSNIEAVQAIRNNSDVTLDFALAKDNAGMVWDIPLLSLGDGRLNVEQDQAITLPLELEAARGENNYTMLFNEFPYLPDAAE